MTIKSVNLVAADFLDNPPAGVTATFDGKPCSIEQAQRVLREGQMFENGCAESGGNELWFSGRLGGEAFVFSLFGAGIAREILQIVFA